MCLYLQVHVDEERFERYSRLGDMLDFVTTDGSSTQLHACRQPVRLHCSCYSVTTCNTESFVLLALYDCETWHARSEDIRSANVAWNNSFRTFLTRFGDRVLSHC